ncbi:MAG TPA: FAD-dependent oxidoreductase [Solirubrobacterales bacterium]|nr:FAD-dependent oxidoreductase [Solirubrobacterales bacterium]
MTARGQQPLRIAVVGGGIAGMAAAEEVGARGHLAEIFEATACLGGRIAPDDLASREIFLGGKNIGRRYRRFRELFERRGRADYEVFGPESGQVWRGRVRKLSFSSPSMKLRLGARLALRGQVGGGKRFLRLARQVKRDPESAHLGDRFFEDLALGTGDPAIPEYVGTALCQDVVRHMTVRMNAAEPGECHLGNMGTNLGLIVDRFDQLTGTALGDWIRTVQAVNTTHMRTRIAGLTRKGGRVDGIVGVDGDERRFDGVVLALPAHAAALVIGEQEAALSSLLCTIRYFPVGVVVAEYDRPAFPEAFAALSAPAGMALSNAGSYGLRDRNVVRYTFSGRSARDRILPGLFDPEELLSEAEGFLGRYAPVARARRLDFAARAFQPGLCAYRQDHAACLREVRARLSALPGLALAGDYMRGASLEACVRSGQEAAEQVLTGARRDAGSQVEPVGGQASAG